MDVYEGKNTAAKEVRISRDKALEMQWKLISEWEPKRDVWPIRFGGSALSVGSIISSLYIMGHYRRKMKLLSFGRHIMFIPGVIIPAMMVPLLHQRMVTDSILLQTACPVCIQVRGVMLQLLVGVSYPLLVHSIGSFSLANTYATYRLPEVSLANLSQYLNIWRKISRPLNSVLPLHLIAQIVLAFSITEWQAKSFFTVQEKLIQKMKTS